MIDHFVSKVPDAGIRLENFPEKFYFSQKSPKCSHFPVIIPHKITVLQKFTFNYRFYIDFSVIFCYNNVVEKQLLFYIKKEK